MLQSCATANTAVSAGGGNRRQYCTRGDDLQVKSSEFVHGCMAPAQGLKTLDERIAGLESQMAHIKSTSEETQRMREHMEQLQVQFNQVVARLEGLDTPTEDGAQTPVGAQTNLMAENLSLLQGEVGQIGRYQRELDVRWDQQRDASNRRHEEIMARLSALERNALQLRQHEETVTKLRQHEETIARHLSAMPGSGVSDQGMNTSLPAYDVPSLNMPSGEPWECGLQLQQWISEFTTVASCVALEFNQYFLQQLETAKSRYDARQIQLKPEDIEAPPVPSHCEEMENRLSLTLMRVLPEQLRKPVMEQSAGQRVSSVRMLEGVFERFIPGGVEEKTSLYRFLRALPSASGFKDLLATLRRMKLARTRAATLGLPGIAPHELVASVNAMTKKLEGKHASLATRLNLLRLSPELIVPSEAGLNTLVATLETEARRMGAEEDVRTSRSGTGTEDYEYTVAAQLKGKGKGRGKGKAAESQDARRVCWYFGTEKGCNKGTDCPFKHVKPSAGKGDRKGKPSSTDTGNAKAEAAASAKEAKAKAKAEAKAKVKAEAKAKAAAAAKPEPKAKAAALVGAEAKTARTINVQANMLRAETPLQPFDSVGTVWIMRLSLEEHDHFRSTGRLLHRLDWTELFPSQGDAPELEIAVWTHYALNGVGSGISVLGWEIDQVDLPSDGSLWIKISNEVELQWLWYRRYVGSPPEPEVTEQEESSVAFADARRQTISSEEEPQIGIEPQEESDLIRMIAINGGHITVDDMPDVWEWEENQIQNPSYAWLKSGQREVNFANLLPIWFWWTRELIKFFVQLDRGIVVKS
ncbi:hypothetical protein AK812_SmicGene17531 [Symbiodinium microadriaticum]|uniref:C3H1-type domain-containing protein n=1 Tax=Symbiodinium microadriaticum TaxID=2951 RepID=A0A1Q9DXE1_SYMMI|nr:hypothetical protein AK812_SmicGene17531 [Symbiodinium microadriaticum]